MDGLVADTELYQLSHSGPSSSIVLCTAHPHGTIYEYNMVMHRFHFAHVKQYNINNIYTYLILGSGERNVHVFVYTAHMCRHWRYAEWGGRQIDGYNTDSKCERWNHTRIGRTIKHNGLGNEFETKCLCLTAWIW